MSEFHALEGDYVANAGQQLNLHGYLDYFEPLGSALSRLADGTGGPFVYQFTAGGGKTIGSIGWVVSAASKRFGGWKLWGMWADRAVPAVALPLFWPELADPSRVPAMVGRANGDAERLFDRKQWKSLCRDIKPERLRDHAFRELLKAELARAYAVPLPHRQPIEVELAPRMLDLLPWLYILGPVDPPAAQIRPSRFNEAGYQYILIDHNKTLRDTEIPIEIDELVDAAASDVARSWQIANELRARRARPKAAPAPPPRQRRVRDEEEDEMPRKPTPEPAWKQVAASAPVIWTIVFQIAALALLAWIAVNVHAIRKANSAAPTTTTSAVVDTALPPAPVPQPVEAETESADARYLRIAQALAARPPQGIRVTATGLGESVETLSRAAVEIFLRRNACYKRSEPVDGKISAAELSAIRTCTALRDARIAGSNGQIDAERAIAWLERLIS